MKTYKKIMNGVAMVEKLILVLATILIVVLTVGNVLSRKLLHQSWSFTEELVVAVFVLITVLSIIFSVILFKYGMDKVLTQLANGKRTFVLNWPEWIFWSFVPIGAACMVLHIIEYFVDYCAKSKKDKEEQEK